MMEKVDSRQSTVDRARGALFAAFVLLSACKREEVALCEASTAKWRAVQSAPSDDAIAAEQRRCLEAYDKLKAGSKECIAKCYAKALDRDGLLDCDRACSVTVQAPP